MTKAVKTNDLPQQLYNWSIKEMQFHPPLGQCDVIMPTVDEFKQICRGNMVDVWKYVISHVHSTQTVRKVQGNLTLAKHKDVGNLTENTSKDKEMQELEVKKQNLTSVLTHVLSEIGHLEKNIGQMQREIIDTEKEYRDKRAALLDVHRKTLMLEEFSKNCTEQIHLYRQLGTHVRNQTETIKGNVSKANGGKVYYTDIKNPLSSSALETACHKNVRESCEAISSYIHQVFQGMEKTAKEKSLSELRLKVGELLAKFVVQDVVQSLVEITFESTYQLKEKTADINIKTDIEKLRFRYEQSGHLTDLSSSPNLLQSVQELIQEGQARHFLQFIQTEKYKNEAYRIQEETAELGHELEGKLQKLFEGKLEDLEHARNLIHSEAALKADKAALCCLMKEVEKIHENVARTVKKKELLFEKYRKIQDFQNVVAKKQSFVHDLVAQNLAANPSLTKQSSSITQYINDSLSSQERRTKDLVAQLHSCVQKEADKFGSLYLSYLLSVPLENDVRMAVNDLSINDLNHDSKLAISQTMMTILSHLKFPMFKAPETILPQCLDIKIKIYDVEALLSSIPQVLSTLRKERSSVQQITDLCQSIEENDDAQLKKSLPVLQALLNKATDTLSQCLRIKDYIIQWWEQPAQHAVPWMTVDGMTLKQWHQRWMVAVTQIRQRKIRH